MRSCAAILLFLLLLRSCTAWDAASYMQDQICKSFEGNDLCCSFEPGSMTLDSVEVLLDGEAYEFAIIDWERQPNKYRLDSHFIIVHGLPDSATFTQRSWWALEGEEGLAPIDVNVTIADLYLSAKDWFSREVMTSVDYYAGRHNDVTYELRHRGMFLEKSSCDVFYSDFTFVDDVVVNVISNTSELSEVHLAFPSVLKVPKTEKIHICFSFIMLQQLRSSSACYIIEARQLAVPDQFLSAMESPWFIVVCVVVVLVLVGAICRFTHVPKLPTSLYSTV